MREIKFRGKRGDNDKWVYGSLLVEMYNFYICPKVDQTREAISQISVNKESIGQYTGLKDKNGVEIYEGDILKAEWGMTDNYVVEDLFDLGYHTIEYAIDEDYIEIIGNIHNK